MKYDHQNWSQIKYNKKFLIHSRRLNSPRLSRKKADVVPVPRQPG